MPAEGGTLLVSSETENILVILTCIYSELHYLIQNEKYILLAPNPVLLSP